MEGRRVAVIACHIPSGTEPHLARDRLEVGGQLIGLRVANALDAQQSPTGDGSAEPMRQLTPDGEVERGVIRRHGVDHANGDQRLTRGRVVRREFALDRPRSSPDPRPRR